MRTASGHHIGHTDYLRWDRDDRLAEAWLKNYDGECCAECGVHPSAWSPKYGADIRHPAVVPKWKFCPVCLLVGLASKKCPELDKDGNPAPGWSLVLVSADEEEVSHD